MKPSQGKRTWVKLFVNEWLEGTTRYQMSDAQRAFWIDLLAMAGRSRFGGIVCSGKDGEELIGYPLSKFQGLLAEPFDVEATLALFERTGKIKMQVSGEGNRKLYVLFILNWAHYQSEYDRTKKYRDASATPNATDLLHQKSHSCYAKGNKEEVEVDVEGEKEKTNPGASAPPGVPVETWNAFAEMRKKLRKPLTEHAIVLLIRKLTKLKDAGEDPVAVVEQSIERGWAGFFPVKKGESLYGRSENDNRRLRAPVGKYDKVQRTIFENT